MTDKSPEETLAEIAANLRRLGRRFALVGGLAVGIRGQVRFTRDVDLVVEVRDPETGATTLDVGERGAVTIR